MVTLTTNSRIILGCVFGFIVIYGLRAASRAPAEQDNEQAFFTRRAAYDGQYGRDAIAALAKFRSELFKMTLAWETTHNESSYNTTHQINYQTFAPFLPCPPGRTIKKYGKKRGDAPKPLCDVAVLAPPCVIYSAGGNNEYTFEEEMLAGTQCSIHTFDCTVNGRSLDNSTRHFFYKTCLGTAPVGSTLPFKHLTQIMQELGHKRVDLFKIDIEGYEYDVFQDWAETDPNLPEQLAIELHYGWPKKRPEKATVRTIPQMAVLLGHLANMGYGIVGFEQNTGPCCAELGLVRVETMVAVSVVVPAQAL